MCESDSSLVVQAPAKVNLTLYILGKRSDGYHDLDTVMQKLDLADTVTLSRCEKPGVQLSCPGSELPEDESNLVWKAAAAFLQETGLEKKCGVSIVLEKKIPVAAGLGGGSSDAGCVLTGMNRLFQTELTEEALLRLAKSLGADVPFFVVPHSAVRATGIGDKMNFHGSLGNCSLLLVNPGFSVSTAWVYKNFTLTRADKDSILSDSRENDSMSGPLCPLHNDLEAVTVKQYPELETIKRFMIDNGASGALMSGSGPTVFGIFPDRSGSSKDAVSNCAEKLIKKYKQGVFVTRPVDCEKN
jgi:4-diphosphocytidyl-2-C-methyl-D-erythritol kinase